MNYSYNKKYVKYISLYLKFKIIKTSKYSLRIVIT